jgi:cyclin C
VSPEINRLGKRLNVRQQALVTAQMYIKRFYLKVQIRRTNPYLVMATAVYLACKMEECPQHIRMVVSEARQLWGAEIQQLDTSKLGECEFFLISEMNSHLIIHQPYRALTSLPSEIALSPEESTLAWSVINDHYMTDLPLIHPPHVIALTAILLAIVLRPSPAGSGGNNQAAGVAMAASMLAQAQQTQAQRQASGTITPGGSQGSSQQHQSDSPAEKKPSDPRMSKVVRFAAFLAESTFDIEAMIDATQEILTFYECHEQFNAKLTQDQIGRYVKARGLDK